MNILFLTLIDMCSVSEYGIYQDLVRELIARGNRVYVASPSERRTGQPTRVLDDGKCRILKVRIGNTQKTNLIEKGISTLLIEPQFKAAIRKHLSDVRFDLVLYSTPPITFASVVEYVKKRDGAKSYLMLKDIFPQNAVDMGMMTTTGPKSILYRFFRQKEGRLYELSDRIGCMSQANVDYLLRNNPEISSEKVGLCPNSIEPRDLSLDDAGRRAMREQYGIPQDKTVFVYGGNLGKPQDIDYLISCLKAQADNADAYFLIVGDGTEYPKLERFVNESRQENVRLMRRLPRDDYDRMIAACDVGLILLDHRFTIPNFPSRLLSYMQAKLPVLACTDANTDIGSVIEEGGFGWWRESDRTENFCDGVEAALKAPLAQMGEAGSRYLTQHYTVGESCNQILTHL